MKRTDRIKRNKEILKKVIQECEARLPMIKMTYPDAVQTDFNGFPKYQETIEQCKRSLKELTKKVSEEKK